MPHDDAVAERVLFGEYQRSAGAGGTTFGGLGNHYRIGEVRAFSARPIPPRINASSRRAWR